MTSPTSPVKHLDPSISEAIASIADQFAIEGEFAFGEEIQSGHINSTYRIGFESADGSLSHYILQRINEKVFKDPIAVMRNVECVTRHINWKVLRVKKDLGGQTLNLYPGRGGKFWVAGPNGGIWRCYNCIEGCNTYDIVENTRQAYQAARAFGSFQDLVSDLPVEEIVETIPDFHNTRKRYQRLMEVASSDPLGRAGEVADELAFARRHEKEIDRILNGIADKSIPERITHNDTKINNVMIDEATDEAVCVIDLDTVMPGSVLYDFGDMVRTAVSPAPEDEQELDRVEMRMPIFEALVEGYLDSARDFLSDAEASLLAFSAKLITFEVGLRFLTDHLEGDRYFKVHRPNHNLDRCRTQFALVSRFDEKMDEMESFVRKVWRGS